MKTNSKGFAAVEVLLIIVIVAVIGFVGYKVMQIRNANSRSSTNTAPIAEEQTIQAQPASVPEVKKTADLDSAEKELDTLNVESELGEANSLQNEVNAL